MNCPVQTKGGTPLRLRRLNAAGLPGGYLRLLLQKAAGRTVAPRSAATAPPSLRNGKRQMGVRPVCSNERDTPPGKLVASSIPNGTRPVCSVERDTPSGKLVASSIPNGTRPVCSVERDTSPGKLVASSIPNGTRPVCSVERDTSPGKLVASSIPNAEVAFLPVPNRLPQSAPCRSPARPYRVSGRAWYAGRSFDSFPIRVDCFPFYLDRCTIRNSGVVILASLPRPARH